MTPDHAAQLTQALKQLDEPLNRASEVLDQLDEGDEKTQLRRELGELMANVYIQLMLPVLREHPELDPDRDVAAS